MGSFVNSIMKGLFCCMNERVDIKISANILRLCAAVLYNVTKSINLLLM